MGKSWAAVCAALATAVVACVSTGGLAEGDGRDDPGVDAGANEAHAAYAAGDAQPDSAESQSACGADTKVDAKNCGACGHDCLGGKCVAGRCQPIVLASAIGKNEAGPVVDGTHVYWVTGTSAPKTFTMVRCALDGCAGAPEIVADLTSRYGTGGYEPMTATQTDIYWTKSGVYNANGVLQTPGALYRITKSTKDVAQLTSGDISSYALRTDGAYLYWASQGQYAGIMRCAVSGCASPEKYVAKQSALPYGLWIDGADLFWTEWDATNGGTVWTRSIAQGTAKRLGTTPATLTPRTLEMHGTTLFFTVWSDGASGYIQRVPDRGNGSSQVLATGLGNPHTIDVDDSFVYWADYNLSNVARVPVGGGASEVLASAEVHAKYVVTDASAVYWVTDDRVMRLAK